MAAFTFLAAKRKSRDAHATLGMMVLAQSGDDKAITKQFEDWEKDV